jgi:large subunit ribosomal protein L22
MATNIKKRTEARAEEKKNNTNVKATARYIRMSPTKVNRVLRLIRNKNYDEAHAILEFTPNAACKPILKVLQSAAANAENNRNLSKSDLYVCTAVADCGPTLKRMMPRAKGSADRILKKTCHITIVLSNGKGE